MAGRADTTIPKGGPEEPEELTRFAGGGAEGGDVVGHGASGVEHGSAGHERGGAGGGDLRDRIGRDAAIDFDLDRPQTAVLNGAAEGGDLGCAGRDVALSTEPGIDAHNEDEINVRQYLVQY